MMNGLNSGSAGLNSIAVSNQDDFVRLPKLQMFKKPGLFPTMLRANAGVTGIILPSFNNDISKHDGQYKTSTMSYRDTSAPREKNGLHPFSGWFVPIGGRPANSKFSVGGVYRYFGKSKSTFISPTSVGLSDPIVDLAIWVRVQKKKYGNSQYMHLVTKAPYNKDNPRDTPPTALPNPTPAVMVNAVCTGSNPHDENKDKLENRVLLMTEMTFKELQKDLASYTPGGMIPVDAANPMMLYGDITNPNGALVFNTREDKDSNITFAKLDFGEAKLDQTGAFVFSGSKMKVTDEMLSDRYDLTDTENVVNIPTYDEIVMQLLVEGLVPREVMIAAEIDKKCAHFPTEEEVKEYIDSYQDQISVVDEVVNNGGSIPAPEVTSAASLQVPSQAVQGTHVAVQSVAQPTTVQTPVVQPAVSQPSVSQQAAVQPTPVQQPQAPAGLSVEEQAEFNALQTKAQQDPTSLSIDDFNRLAILMQKVK